MRRQLTRLLLTAALVAFAGPGATHMAGAAEELRPLDLQVLGGAESWRSDNDFRIDWTLPAVGGRIAATAHRVYDSSGAEVVPVTRRPWAATRIDGLHLPNPRPGIYRAEIWFEESNGKAGPVESVELRFDDGRPAAARPLVPAGWVAGGWPVQLQIERPAGPQPLAGIRGYAVSVDRDPDGVPCAGAERCTLAETDLRTGIEGDVVSLEAMPEGVSYVHAVAVSSSGMRSREVRTATLRVDSSGPQVRLTGAGSGWADGPVRVVATAVDELSGMGAGGPNGAFTAIAVDGGVPRAAAGGSAAATVTGEGTHTVSFHARDAVGNGAEGRAAATVRIDEGAPLVSFAIGQDPRDPERIEAAVGDPLSGPDPLRGSIAVRPAGSRQQFQPLPTAVTAGGRLAARWDSDSFAPGGYEFRAIGYDAAGNATVAERRANGARMVLASPLKAPVRIEAGFGGRRLVWQRCTGRPGERRCRRRATESFAERPSSRVVPYGRGVAFGGRLTSSSGAPLAGLPVEVTETFAPGADLERRTSTVLTAADGRFLARLAPGPGRRVEAAFAGNRTLTRANSAAVALSVLAGVRLRASTAAARIGGAAVVFSGRLGAAGAPLPAAGRPVELQFRLPGRAWSEFRTVQTDAQGRFRYPYAFSDDDSRGIRFQFRAHAPRGDDWPYEPASSRPIFVTGR